MSNKILNTVLVAILVLLVQTMVTDYFLMVAIWVLCGALMAFRTNGFNFLQGIVGGLIAGLILWFGFVGFNSTPLENMLSSAGVDGVWLIVIFLAFTMLNTGFCFLAGHSLVRLFKPKA